MQPAEPGSFRSDWQAFIAFLRSPSAHARLRRPGLSGWRQELLAGTSPIRLLRWAALLWLVNLLVLGPLAALTAEAAGAQRRFDWSNIPWVHALLWAPVFEELLFRLGLRRPMAWVLLMPMLVAAVFTGPELASLMALLAGFVMLIALGPQWRQPRPMLRLWHDHFGWLVYGSTVLFAVVHVLNFEGAPLPAWPLLVLPQFVTGLVLAWMRVRHGVGSAILLHALFNAGPLLLIALLLSLGRDPEGL
jgi:membrane protease YdiL (CAAX protease family)